MISRAHAYLAKSPAASSFMTRSNLRALRTRAGVEAAYASSRFAGFRFAGLWRGKHPPWKHARVGA